MLRGQKWLSLKVGLTPRLYSGYTRVKTKSRTFREEGRLDNTERLEINAGLNMFVRAHPLRYVYYPNAGRQSPVLVLLSVELGSELISRRGGELIFARKQRAKIGLGVFFAFLVCAFAFGGRVFHVSGLSGDVFAFWGVFPCFWRKSELVLLLKWRINYPM